MNASHLAILKRTLRSCYFVLAAIALAAPPVFAGVNRWTSSGPFEVPAIRQGITSLAIDPLNPETVYAGTGQEVFKSRNGGLSWTTSFHARSTCPTSFWGTRFSDLAIDPLFPARVYAATGEGVLKSTNGGGSWAALGAPCAYSVAVDPMTPSTVLAGTASGLLRSTDGGASWSGSHIASSIYTLVFTPQTPSRVVAADFDAASYYPYPSSLSESTNGGMSWNTKTTGIAINPGALAIDPTNPSTLYAGAPDFLVGPSGVYKSVDAGSTWRQEGALQWVHAVVIDPRNPRTLYAGNFGGVFRSMDGGATWADFSTGLPNPPNRSVASLAIDRTGTRLYAGTDDGRVFEYQIFSRAALDLSVGSDHRARLLLVDLDNRAAFPSFDNAGNSTNGGSHGPYSGWTAKALADGSDGLTRVLWNHLDGSAALWLLGPTGNLASHVYRLGSGWTPVDVSVGRDNTTRLLWTNTDGRTALTSVDVSGALIGSATYGPYTGWLARSISNGSDGLTHVLWSNTDGRFGLSLIGAEGIVATHRFAGPPGFAARDIAVASDNQTRILWTSADGRLVLWSMDNSGAVTNSGTVYHPPAPGQEATRISAAADGLTRVLWPFPDGTGSVWLMSLDNVRQSSFPFCGRFGESSECGPWDY